LLFALCLLLGAPVWAQDNTPEDPEINEGMLEVCPALKGAQGRAKEQLMLLFFEGVEPTRLNDASQKRIRGLFDLGNAGDVTVLSRYLDALALSSCIEGLRAVFVAHGKVGLVWLLERYAAAKPARRGRLIELIRVFDQREVWRLLIHLLRDKTPVPDLASAVIAPPGYTSMRVCDHALRALGAKLAKRKEVELPGGRRAFSCHATLPIKTRDRRVAKVGAFLGKNEPFQTVLVSAPSLLESPDADVKSRVKALAKVLGLGK
jgi:hypothetical protein